MNPVGAQVDAPGLNSKVEWFVPSDGVETFLLELAYEIAVLGPDAPIPVRARWYGKERRTGSQTGSIRCGSKEGELHCGAQ
jgi:hypothetical protein